MFTKLTLCLVVVPLAIVAQSSAPPEHAAQMTATSAATPSQSAPAAIASIATRLRHRHDSGLDAGPTDSMPGISAGVRVIIDPQTHELRDTPATAEQARQIQDANAALPRPDYSRMEMETRPDGIVVLHTNGQIMMSSSVHMNADGSYEEICAPSAAAQRVTPAAKKSAGADKEKSP